MTSYGGGDDGESARPEPAPPPPVVYNNLVEVHKHAMKLQIVLQGSLPPAARDAGRELVKEMMAKLSSAMSVLGATGGAASSSGASQGPGRRRKRSGAAAASSSSSGPRRRTSSRRRTKSPFIKMVTTSTISDDKSWRKYGQKKIQDSTKPRSYYRCTHKPDQGCMATRQVQQSESNPSEFVISYYGKHTCRDLSTLSSLFAQGANIAAPPNCANLISFAPINGAAGAATASTSTTVFPRHSVKETMDQAMLFTRYSSYSLLPAQDGAPSGSASSACYGKFVQHGSGELGDVLGRTSALTVGSAPAEYWPVVGVAGIDMDSGAGMVDSFPSSPSSLGFGSLGSFGNNHGGDDDLFDFDS